MKHFADLSPGPLVVFSLDERCIALRLASVERIHRIVEITPLPKAPDVVLGVVNVRGTIIPVFDLRRRFRLPGRETNLTDQLILARAGARRVALVVDGVLDVVEYPAEAVVSPEQILPGLEYVSGVVKTSDGMLLIHDLETFLSLDEEAALNRALTASASEKP